MKNRIKPYALLIVLLMGFCINSQVQATTYNMNQPSGNISILGSQYVDNVSNTWNINIGDIKPVRISYSVDVENSYDNVKIYAVNADSSTTLVATLTGSTSGTISTVVPTGKAKIVFTSDGSVSSASGYIGFTLNFATDYTTSTYSSGNTYTTGNNIISGNLGIGTLNPSCKLHISNNSSFTGKGGAYISVIQKQPSPTIMDGSLTVEYSISASSATNEMANVGGYFRTNNYLTGGGTVQYQRVLNLASGSVTGATTTNLEMIRMETGGSTGTTTNAYGLNIVTLPGTNRWGIYDQSNSNWYTSGNVGIGETLPKVKLSVVGNAAIGYGGQTAPSNGLIVSGKVGIGTNNPDSLLTVNGTIHAKGIKIDLTGAFADFVFDKNYKLKSLSEVSTYIKDNGHLPNIPSADEVSKDGINVAEMQVKLLQKIEELTLYIIEQQKQIEALKLTQKAK